MDLIKLSIEAIVVFVAIFLLNYFFFVKEEKKLNKDEMPLELIYLSGIYGIDPSKINFRKFQYTYSLVNALVITITYLLVMYLIKNMIMRVILGIIILVLLIIIFYGLLGRYYLYLEEKEELNKQKNNSKKKTMKKKK